MANRQVALGAREGPQEPREQPPVLSAEDRLTRFKNELRDDPKRARMGDANLWMARVDALLNEIMASDYFRTSEPGKIWWGDTQSC